MARLLQEIERAAARTNSKVATDFLSVSDRIGGVEASVELNAQAIATLEGAFSSYQVTVTAQFNELQALVQTNATAITTLDQAFSQYQVTVQAQFGDVSASVNTVATAISTLNSAFASYQVQVNAQLNGISANVSAVATANATLEGAFAAYQVTVTAAFAAAAAAVDANYVSNADLTSAFASYNVTVATTYATQTALGAVSLIANATQDAVETIYSLRLDVNGYIVGYTFMNNGSQGVMRIRADTFEIVTTGQAPKTMFQVANVNGVPTITLAGNVIYDGQVNTMQMANNAATVFGVATPASTLNSPISGNDIVLGTLNVTVVAGSVLIFGADLQISSNASLTGFAQAGIARQTFRLWVDSTIYRSVSKIPPLNSFVSPNNIYAWSEDIITISHVLSGLSPGVHTIALTVVNGTGALPPATMNYTNIIIKSQESRR